MPWRDAEPRPFQGVCGDHPCDAKYRASALPGALPKNYCGIKNTNLHLQAGASVPPSVPPSVPSPASTPCEGHGDRPAGVR